MGLTAGINVRLVPGPAHIVPNGRMWVNASQLILDPLFFVQPAFGQPGRRKAVDDGSISPSGLE